MFSRESVGNLGEGHERIRGDIQKKVENGDLLIAQLDEMINKDRPWLGEGLYEKSKLYIMELRNVLYTREVSNDDLKRFQRFKDQRRETLESIRKRLLAGRDSENVDEMLHEVLGDSIRTAASIGMELFGAMPKANATPDARLFFLNTTP